MGQGMPASGMETIGNCDPTGAEPNVIPATGSSSNFLSRTTGLILSGGGGGGEGGDATACGANTATGATYCIVSGFTRRVTVTSTRGGGNGDGGGGDGGGGADADATMGGGLGDGGGAGGSKSVRVRPTVLTCILAITRSSNPSIVSSSATTDNGSASRVFSKAGAMVLPGRNTTEKRTVMLEVHASV